MKRQQLIEKILASGCVYVRPGAKHDLYMNPRTGKKQPVPRHREIETRARLRERRCLA